MTRNMAHELAPHGIRVNAVAPGYIATGLSRSLAVDEQALERLAARRIPMGRLGHASEIADAVAFLASPAASYVTGHVMVVDGGWLT